MGGGIVLTADPTWEISFLTPCGIREGNLPVGLRGRIFLTVVLTWEIPSLTPCGIREGNLLVGLGDAFSSFDFVVDDNLYFIIY